MRKSSSFLILEKEKISKSLLKYPPKVEIWAMIDYYRITLLINKSLTKMLNSKDISLQL